jgi:hypothetical protein
MDIRFMEEAEDKRANTQTSERKSRPYHGLRHRSPYAARGNGRSTVTLLRGGRGPHDPPTYGWSAKSARVST